MTTIAENLAAIRATIPDGVRLLAVSKTFPAAAIRAAYGEGVRDFGESRIQEAIAKQADLADLTDIQWHFIGHLQSNKAKKALTHFDWIHTCDHLALAQRLDRLTAQLGKSPKILLQVKPCPDPDKYGWPLESLGADLPALAQCQHLNIQGLMTILPLGLTSEEIRQAFQATQTTAAQIHNQFSPALTMTELSMGMSGDYPLAIAAGATMIRIGRGIFGDRPPFSPKT
ncbi:YggS family pyridoxal phosphate-dependent enzyme [Spirulina sp. CCNP1310]|uniref:YggS family pyridoxal phosphate-dependent enzyme n=1 Tax=Spirulina sp. CCNP1310 TaxID=3110249 RepID=UPI002B1F6E8F|nr:YggS family pyridoxal phosphate-dependent enzyme [Spirulina sp. CCNP1310]MEA5419817.1 YggS family pyridoxal phosphate-dependent enzyme [Spirulina sp. CCNP1310]